jgi:hypothetical protein
VTYIPAPPVLTDVTPGTSDQWDGFAGFEELAVVWCVIAIKNQQEEDVQAEILESKALIADIHNSASTRDDAEPPRVRDVSAELAGEAWPWWND